MKALLFAFMVLFSSLSLAQSTGDGVETPVDQEGGILFIASFLAAKQMYPDIGQVVFETIIKLTAFTAITAQKVGIFGTMIFDNHIMLQLRESFIQLGLFGAANIFAEVVNILAQQAAANPITKEQIHQKFAQIFQQQYNNPYDPFPAPIQ